MKYMAFMGSRLKAEAGAHCPLLAPPKAPNAPIGTMSLRTPMKPFLVFPPFEEFMGFNAEKKTFTCIHLAFLCASEPAILAVSSAEKA